MLNRHLSTGCLFAFYTQNATDELPGLHNSSPSKPLKSMYNRLLC